MQCHLAECKGKKNLYYRRRAVTSEMDKDHREAVSSSGRNAMVSLDISHPAVS